MLASMDPITYILTMFLFSWVMDEKGESAVAEGLGKTGRESVYILEDIGRPFRESEKSGAEKKQEEEAGIIYIFLLFSFLPALSPLIYPSP